jgi:hydrogenase maturation protein HypF
VCRDTVSYEGQAAIELEALVDREVLEHESDELAYPFSLPRLGGKGLPYIEPLAMWQAVLGDLLLNTPVPVMAARFHKGLSRAIVALVCKLHRQQSSSPDRRPFDTVALSGGVFQNAILLQQVATRLAEENLRVLMHERVPANDAGLALGQALIGAAQPSI